jgi:hypothetical protein
MSTLALSMVVFALCLGATAFALLLDHLFMSSLEEEEQEQN